MRPESILSMLQVRKCSRRKRRGADASAVGLTFYRVNDDVMKLLTRGGYLDDIGKDNIFPARSRAVGFIYPNLDIGDLSVVPEANFQGVQDGTAQRGAPGAVAADRRCFELTLWAND